jgi:hypothetical protein
VDAKTGKILWKVNREDDPRWTHAQIYGVEESGGVRGLVMELVPGADS